MTINFSNLQPGEMPQVGKIYYRLYFGRAWQVLEGWQLEVLIRRYSVVGDPGLISSPSVYKGFCLSLQLLPATRHRLSLWVPKVVGRVIK